MEKWWNFLVFVFSLWGIALAPRGAAAVVQVSHVTALGEQFERPSPPGLSCSRPLPFVCSKGTMFCQRLLCFWNDVLSFFVWRYSQSRIHVARFFRFSFRFFYVQMFNSLKDIDKDSKCNVQATIHPTLRRSSQ